MKSYRCNPAIFILALFTVSSASLAQDSNWYAGVAVGQTGADFSRPLVPHLDYAPFLVRTGPSGPLPITTSTLAFASVDDTATNFEFLLGYSISEFLALEAGYNKINSVGATVGTDEIITWPLIPATYTGERLTSVSRESTGATLSLLGSFPLSERLSFLGLVGVMYTHAELSQRIQTSNTSGSSGASERNVEENNSSWFVGLGTDVSLSSRTQIRLLYKYYPEVNDQVYGNIDSNNNLVKHGSVDLQQVNVGLIFKF